MMNNSEYEFFVPSGNKITTISPAVVLNYRVAGNPTIPQGQPALSKPKPEISEEQGGWRIRFTLTFPELKQALPTDDAFLDWDISARDNGDVGNELVAVILPLGEGQIKQIENIVGLPVVVHSFALCKDNPIKICSDCKAGCGCDDEKPEDTKLATYKTKLPIRGVEFAEAVKEYSRDNKISYEQALITLSMKGE